VILCAIVRKGLKCKCGRITSTHGLKSPVTKIEIQLNSIKTGGAKANKMPNVNRVEMVMEFLKI